MSNPINRNTPESVDNSGIPADQAAYEEGYLQGQAAQQRVQEPRYYVEEERYIARENDGAGSGFLLGLLGLLAVLGLGVGAYFFLNQRDESPTQILNIPVPNNSQPQNSQPQGNDDTTIIDRTIEKTREVVPVPQQQAPAPQQQAPSSAPDININVPSTEGQAPDANTAPEQSENQGADTENSGSGQ